MAIRRRGLSYLGESRYIIQALALRPGSNLSNAALPRKNAGTAFVAAVAAISRQVKLVTLSLCATEGSTDMTLKELADKLEVLDEDAFVSLLQLEYTHDGEPGQVKAMMIEALRFADANGMKAARPPLDSAD
jgi:hypothetical protein